MKSKVFMLIVILFYLCSPSHSQEQGLQLEARGTYWAKERKLKVQMVLINQSQKPLTVLTENLNNQLFRADPARQKCVFGMDTIMEYEGHPLIPSYYKRAPVELRPGEAALFWDTVTYPSLEIHEDTEFRVGYRIPQDLGERFDIWHGEIESDPIQMTVVE